MVLINLHPFKAQQHVLTNEVSYDQVISCGHTTDYLGKLDLLTVYLGNLDFSSVTDFSLGSLPRGNFIVRGLNMSLDSYPKAI